MTNNEIKELIYQLQARFDYLFNNHLNPLEMRRIGCRILALKKEIENYEQDKTTTSTDND